MENNFDEQTSFLLFIVSTSKIAGNVSPSYPFNFFWFKHKTKILLYI